MDERPLVIQTERLDAECAAWLRERCEVVECDSENEPRFGELLGRAAGLVIRTYTRVDAAMLARAPGLRVVGRAGVGLDNVDVEACRARGVAVVHTPDANTQAVVEYVLALMLDALRPRLYLERALSREEWKNARAALLAERQLSELTLGVWGFGRVGSRLARAAGAIGMRVMYFDLLEIPEERRQGAEAVSRERLLAESDVLSLHVDARPGNRGMVGAGALAAMKRDVVIVNTSRGMVVDAAALAEFLRMNPEAMALLDVHEPEPFGPEYPLLGLPNAVLSPHLGAATEAAHRAMSWVVREVWEVLR